MLLTDLSFLFRFLPLWLLGWFGAGLLKNSGTRQVFRQLWLMAGSIVFYLGGFSLQRLWPLALLLLSVGVNYALSVLMAASRSRSPKASACCLILSVVFNLSILIWFKYSTEGVPLGMSFYTFSAISYCIDVFRGEYFPKDILLFLNYLLFFPKMLQGPISRFRDFQEDMDKVCDSRLPDPDKLEEGLILFICGMALQGVLAGKLGSLWSHVWSIGPYGFGTIPLWIGAWGYSLQLYFDFFGYSLMALGLAGIVGFTLPQNFDSPYASLSFSDFWRRWHMTLGSWFRDYLYIPLGGSKKGTGRLFLATAVTWLATGLWHGPGWNFLLWAGLFCFLILLERGHLRKHLKKFPLLGHIYVLLLVPMSWMVFVIGDLKSLREMLQVMCFIPLKGSMAPGILDGMAALRPYIWVLALGILFATPYPEKLLRKYIHTWPVRLLMLGLFWFSVWQIYKSGSSPFLYLAF